MVPGVKLSAVEGRRDCSIPGSACAGPGGAPIEQGRAASWQRAAAGSAGCKGSL